MGTLVFGLDVNRDNLYTWSHEGGGESYGHSLIINPWGEVIRDGGETRGIISASIDISLVKKFRKQLPSLNHDKDFQIKKI